MRERIHTKKKGEETVIVVHTELPLFSCPLSVVQRRSWIVVCHVNQRVSRGPEFNSLTPGVTFGDGNRTRRSDMPKDYHETRALCSSYGNKISCRLADHYVPGRRKVWIRPRQDFRHPRKLWTMFRQTEGLSILLFGASKLLSAESNPVLVTRNIEDILSPDDNEKP